MQIGLFNIYYFFVISFAFLLLVRGIRAAIGWIIVKLIFISVKRNEICAPAVH